MRVFDKSRAFTLIELLVVIAIIAILAAILFPVFAKARERAKTTACINNMKQIGLACMQYVDDYDGRYPKDYGYPSRTYWTWKRAIQPYIKSTEVWRCPSLTNAFPKAPGALPYQGDLSNLDPEFRTNRAEWLPASYAFNGAVFEEKNVGDRPRRMDEFKDPSGTIFVVNSRMAFPDLGPWCMGWRVLDPQNLSSYSENAKPGDPGIGPFQHHAGRIPMAMLDGHVETLKLAQTYGANDRWKSERYTAAQIKAWGDGMADEYR